jgi:hypothetical protein
MRIWSMEKMLFHPTRPQFAEAASYGSSKWVTNRGWRSVTSHNLSIHAEEYEVTWRSTRSAAFPSRTYESDIVTVSVSHGRSCRSPYGDVKIKILGVQLPTCAPREPLHDLLNYSHSHTVQDRTSRIIKSKILQPLLYLVHKGISLIRTRWHGILKGLLVQQKPMAGLEAPCSFRRLYVSGTEQWTIDSNTNCSFISAWRQQMQT